jgi:hypothetical protein
MRKRLDEARISIVADSGVPQRVQFEVRGLQ